MFEKPSARINQPPQRHDLKDEGTVIGLNPWFEILSMCMSQTVKNAVKCGMPLILAEKLYENALKDALPMAVRVTKQTDGFNPGIGMMDETVYGIAGDGN